MLRHLSATHFRRAAHGLHSGALGLSMTDDVFISYARSDKSEAVRLAELLRRHHLAVWWDGEMLPGAKFRAEIRAKLESARKVIVLWSPHSVSEDRDFVWDEAAMAKRLNKLIPCAIGGIGRDRIPLGFGELTTIIVTSWETQLLQLLNALGKISQIDPPLNTRAPDLASGPPVPMLVIAPSPKPGFWQGILGRFPSRPTDEDPKLAVGRSLYAQSKWSEAIDAFSEVIAATPHNGAAYQHRAEALAQLARWQGCLEDCKRAHERAPPEDTAALMLGGGALTQLAQWGEAAKWYEAAIARNNSLAAAYCWSAYALVQTGAWTPALGHVLSALRLDRDMPDPHWLRGYIMIGLKQPEEAIEWLSSAIRRFPELALAYYARAYEHAQLSGWPETAADCARAVELSPTLPDAHWLRGFAILQRVSPESDAAIAEFEAAIRLKPDYEQAIHALLWAHAQRANWLGVLDESNKALSQAIAWARERAPDRDAPEGTTEIEHVVFSPRVRALRAEAHRNLRKWKECIEECGAALSQSPKLLDALRIRGLAYLQQNKTDNASQDFSRALAIDPQDALAFCWRSCLSRIRRDYAASLADLDRAIELQPKLPLAYYHRGWTHLAVADTATEPVQSLEKAHADFSTLVQEAKKSGEGHAGLAEVARRRKQGDQALSHLAKAQAIEPELANAHLVRGWLQIDRKEWALATTNFTAVLRHDPENASVHIGLGESARAQRQWASALSHYADALRYDPQALAAHTLRAAVHVELLDFPEATKDYDNAIQLAGELGVHDALADCRAGRAWVRFEQGDDGSALADIKSAAELAPGSSYVFEQWGNLLGFMGKWDEALKKFERAVELDGKSASNWLSRALAHGYLRALDQAIADIDASIALDGKDASRLNLLGWIHNLRGAWPEAEADCNEACALDPGHEFAHANRAEARFRRGETGPASIDLDRLLAITTEEGRRAEPKRSRMSTYAWRALGEGWARAVDVLPNEPVAHYGRAVSHWLAGDIENAQSESTAAVTIGLKTTGPCNLEELLRVR